MKTQMTQTKSIDPIDYENISVDNYGEARQKHETTRSLNEKGRERHSYKSSSSSVSASSYHQPTSQEGSSHHSKECSREKDKWKFSSQRSKFHIIDDLFY
jgi:hypothetical protein